jgi:quercetin dioxygenase-like cupin family protein
MSNIVFSVVDWKQIPSTEHPGHTGSASCKTQQWKGLRVRLVEYSKGYFTDHWCTKGHIVHCLEGAFTSELQHGQAFELTAGMSYVVSDGVSAHRSKTITGVKLLIIDGDFLK